MPLLSIVHHDAEATAAVVANTPDLHDVPRLHDPPPPYSEICEDNELFVTSTGSGAEGSDEVSDLS